MTIGNTKVVYSSSFKEGLAVPDAAKASFLRKCMELANFWHKGLIVVVCYLELYYVEVYYLLTSKASSSLKCYSGWMMLHLTAYSTTQNIALQSTNLSLFNQSKGLNTCCSDNKVQIFVY